MRRVIAFSLRKLKNSLTGYDPGDIPEVWHLKCGINPLLMNKDYAELRKKSRYTKTIATTPEVYQWIEENRGKKPRAQFVTEIIEEYRKPNLFKSKN